jgi:maltooligosyltrehalose trehalohydrolase
VNRPLGAVPDGAGRTSFNVWAPDHDVVTLVLGDDREVVLERDHAGYHAAVVDGAGPGTRYRYRLGEELLADPASRLQPEGVHGPSAVVDVAFPWTDQAWRSPPLAEWVVYELHVGTFTPEGTFAAAAERLADLAALGVRAVELMPIAQFPGGRNWGYDGVLPFAAQDTYGGPDGLRAFVDAAHSHGLAVVVDVVYNHLGPEGNRLGEWGPYFTSDYRTPWGDALNFAGAGSDEVRRYFVESAIWWIAGCHVDGLRLDAVHAIVDPSPVPFVQQLAAEVRQAAARAGRDVTVIAESAANDPRAVRAVEAGGLGLDGQWSDDFHHALHTLLTGERDGYYVDFGGLTDLARAYTHAFVYDGRHSPFRGHRHGAPASGIPGERFVVFSQNHDQIGNRAIGDRLAASLEPAALRLAAAAVLLAPFVPLLFMGEEHGETAPFPYFVSHTDPELVAAVQRGRAEEFPPGPGAPPPPDPAAEETFASAVVAQDRTPEGKALLGWYARLLQLRRDEPALTALDREATAAGVDEPAQSLVLTRDHPDGAVVAVMHFGDGQVDVPLPRAARWTVLADSAGGPWGDGEGAVVQADRVRLGAWGVVVLRAEPA